ncbi:cell wall / vacuolar inhibitor of fructosidase 1-like [Silene latifolia]|uniref:cell wall / vacuolar inhibitor of fructosidase 1-like n=1 Tax=Silene latifolia TaxID=37657 RepID=UPI003D773DE3
MEKTLTCVVFLCLIAYNIIFTKAQTKAVNLIDFTCKQAPDYNICASILNSDPRSRSAQDMKALATILMDHVNDKARSTQHHIETLFNDPKTDSKTKINLRYCIGSYGMIVGTWIQAAKAKIANNEYSRAKDYIYSIRLSVEMCERNFAWLGHIKSPITDDSKAVDDIAIAVNGVVTYKITHPSPPMN